MCYPNFPIARLEPITREASTPASVRPTELGSLQESDVRQSRARGGTTIESPNAARLSDLGMWANGLLANGNARPSAPASAPTGFVVSADNSMRNPSAAA